MTKQENNFISFFPNTKYRYLDLSGKNKPAISSDTIREDLNKAGYDSFFTVNGFKGDTAVRENCVNLNAFFVDIDKKLTEKEIKDISNILPPTFITETFNGFHFYWCLDEILYKEEIENWEDIMLEWERIEKSIIDTIKDADKQVKDIPRILRVPNSIYWKKTNGEFKIKGYKKSPACVYSFKQVLEAFPIQEEPIALNTFNPSIDTNKMQKYAEAEKRDFFSKVNEKYLIEDRPSFQKLITGSPDTLPKGEGQRNHALLITASLMRQAGWSKKKALEHFAKIGWHGIEKERGGMQEIQNTVNSAFNSQYTFSYKNEIIAWNMSDEEQMKIQDTFNGVLKERKEKDKVRFSNYEKEIFGKISIFEKK